MGRGMGSHQSSASKSVVWLTPPEIVAALGPFDLDPCAAPLPRPWDTARRHIALPDNGLEAEWVGRVWMNPPYGSPKVIGPWMRRLAAHNHGTAIIFARTETALFFETVWRNAAALLFLEGRLHFHTPDGIRALENGGAPSVLVAYGLEDADRLASSGIGGAFVPLQLPRLFVVMALETSWVQAVVEFARASSGPVLVEELYRAFASHPKARRNANWRAKLRQSLQRGPFRRSARGTWELMT